MKNIPQPTSNDARRSERLIELFEQARELPQEQRSAFLDKVCDDNETMRRELESLLEHANPALPTSALKLAARQLAEEQQQDFTGRQINQYKLLSVLGQGGMGKVYQAEDTRLARSVALKFLPGSFLTHASQYLRFEQEARAVSALNHPNIVTIHEIGQHEGAPYIAYELVEGETLRQRLQSGALSWQEAVTIGAQVAAALKAAHSAGIIHRDIKPENIMLRADGLVKVLDFGIAKLGLGGTETERQGDGETEKKRSSANSDTASLSASHSSHPAISLSLTEVGLVLGTPGYLSPEQGRGEEIDAGTDIFSLGVVLYEMLAGHPYANLTPQAKLEAAISAEELPVIGAKGKEIPAALFAIVTTATRKERNQRFSSADEMLDALNELRPPTQTKLAEHARRLKQKRANQLLNQSVALYAGDKSVRLSPAALWRVWRHSTVKRGRLESALLRKSLLNALGKVAATALLAGLVTLGFAAWGSIAETWELKVMQDGHADMIRDMALSPDGKTLVSGGNDKAAIVWDVERAERRATLKFEQARYIGSVAYSPDGKWFATSSTDQKVTVWDAAQFSKVKELPGEDTSIRQTLAFTPDGRLLMAHEQVIKNSQHKMINLWDVQTWQSAYQLAPLGNLLVSPDSRFLLGYSWRTFDLTTRKEIRPSAENFGRGALSPNAERLATLDKAGFVSFWDLRRFWTLGERRLIARYAAHRDGGRAIAYSPDGRMVATGSDNIIVWDAETHAKIARFPYRDLANDLAFSPDSKRLFSAHGDGAILEWDLAEKEMARNFAEHSGVVRTVSFSADGKTLASASEDRSIILWDAETGLKRGALSGLGAPFAAAVLSADGKQLVSADIYGQITVWDTMTRAPLRSFALLRKDGSSLNFCLAVSPDQKWATTTYGLYSIADGRLVVDFLQMQDSNRPDIRGAAFSPDGRWLVCVATDGRIHRWEVGSWNFQEIKRQGNIVAVAFAPDSQRLAIGESSGAIRLWQIDPLQEIALIGEHAANVESLSFSPDGRWLASASADETVKLWDVEGRRFIRNIGTHKPTVQAVAFSPDGKRLATGEHDKTVRIYTQRRSLWGWSLD